jgi:hypothetical protein
MILVSGIVGLLTTVLGSAAGGQVPTDITVRVVSHDAKIVGSGVGGARIVIREITTGAVLAEGVQEGETGDTRALVVDPIARGAPVYDTPGAAHFTATLSLMKPTVVEVIGEGPLGHEEAMQRTSTTLLLIPGEHVTGNGVVLVLHGFIVEILEPAELMAGGDSAAVQARVRMACGCPLEPGGLWDAERVEVAAYVYSGERLVSKKRLAFAGEPSMFAGGVSLRRVHAGDRLVIMASDPTRANFGRSQAITVR